MTKMLAGDVSKALECLDRLDLPDVAAEARALRERSGELGRMARTAPGDLRAERRRLARSIADGTTDLEAALDETGELARSARRAEAAADLLRMARQEVDAAAGRVFADLGESILEPIRKRLAPDLAAAKKAAAQLPAEIVDDAAAVAAGGQILTAWSTLTRVHETWTTATHLVRILREADVIACAGSVPAQDRFLYEMRHPERATKVPSGARLHPVALFAADIANGVEHDLLTAAEAAETLDRERARRLAERAAA